MRDKGAGNHTSPISHQYESTRVYMLSIGSSTKVRNIILGTFTSRVLGNVESNVLDIVKRSVLGIVKR